MVTAYPTQAAEADHDELDWLVCRIVGTDGRALPEQPEPRRIAVVGGGTLHLEDEVAVAGRVAGERERHQPQPVVLGVACPESRGGASRGSRPSASGEDSGRLASTNRTAAAAQSARRGLERRRDRTRRRTRRAPIEPPAGVSGNQRPRRPGSRARSTQARTRPQRRRPPRTVSLRGRFTPGLHRPSGWPPQRSVADTGVFPAQWGCRDRCMAAADRPRRRPCMAAPWAGSATAGRGESCVVSCVGRGGAPDER